MEKNPYFGFPFPIPLYMFTEILDCILDLLSVICLFVPNSQPASNTVSLYTIKNLVEIIIKLLDSIVDGGPYDLVDVTADHIRVSIKIR
ncbi:hypothetical protein Ana3638_22485 [Anaerocolumna sedimenticola]|uniref:Uncharacterized protein n=1 Tax=Anaerocolumna sedimenticola TaxID=2696063 RepID=A0A6P1TSK8_9FIRM|nr:hypothetical protein [Anaerocolumna sedimenticola]QHQ63199.1 hypothetical protein Ana3638_22485 [Anaerocolumna sedimenticola]